MVAQTNLPSVRDYIAQTNVPSVRDYIAQTNLPSVRDYKNMPYNNLLLGVCVIFLIIPIFWIQIKNILLDFY